MKSQCVQLLDAIKKSTTILCEDVEFQFDNNRLKRICNAFNIVDPKKKAVEIINATEIDTELQSHEAFNADIEYDRERMFDQAFSLKRDDIELKELYKIKEQDIISVAEDNGLPSKIWFNKLYYPIYSLSFMSVIREVRFGRKKNYLYKRETYSDTKLFLLNKGYDIPENIFQTHYFFVYLYEFLPITYVESCFTNNYDEVLSGVFRVIDLIQHLNGHKTAKLYNEPLQYRIESIDNIDKENLDKMMTDYWPQWDPGPCRRSITIKNYHMDGSNAGILYNNELNKYMGVYHSDIDVTDFFRSVPDFINSKLSQPHTLLLLATYRTYVIDNEVSIDDGVEYEIIINRWGPNIDYCLYIITKGFDCNHILDMDDHREILSRRLGIPINEIDEQHPGFTQGWLRAIPW